MSIKWPKVVLFGDSQVQRAFEPVDGLWGALLANRFQRMCDVVTRGFSGYNSRSCLNVIQHLFQPENVLDVCSFVIFLGTNDSSGGKEGISQHVPLEEYFQNLEKMIIYLQEIGLNKDKIILITPGPYHHEKFMEWCTEIGRTFPSRDNNTTLKYAEACVNVGKKFNLDVINLYQEMMQHEDWPTFLKDGVHLTKKGSTLLYEALCPVIEKRVDTSKMLLPYWRDFNHLHGGDEEKENITKLIISGYSC